MTPTKDKPRLTTRRTDGFSAHESELLRACQNSTVGIVWLIHGKHHSDLFLAAHALQRLGYLWPTQEGKPIGRDGLPVSGSFGWIIEPEGRAALEILDAKAAAA